MKLRTTRESAKLPGVKLAEGVTATGDLAAAARADAILLAIPAQNLRAAVAALVPHLKAGTPLVACAKGIERGTHQFMTEIIAEAAPAAIPAILSGPSFAADVAAGLPTAVTLACRDDAIATALAHALSSATFRIYHATDVRGVEVGGAAKNVLAIAAGIVAGRRLGASALAALTTRGFAELARFGAAMGAQSDTLAGLSGLGDLLLELLLAAIAQLRYGMALGARRSAVGQARGGRVHGAGSRRTRTRERRRHADHAGRHGDPVEQARHRRCDRRAAGAADQVGDLKMAHWLR